MWFGPVTELSKAPVILLVSLKKNENSTPVGAANVLDPRSPLFRCIV